LRIVIVKLSHERATDCGELLDVTDMRYANLGEEYRADIRYLDLKPFDSLAFGSLSLTAAEFYSLDPAVAYELSINPIAPKMLFGFCSQCDNHVTNPRDTLCETCGNDIPF